MSANTSLAQDKATVLKVWAAVGGTKQALTNGSDDVSSWKGITVWNGRVTNIDWHESKPPLSGVISKEIGKLSELTWLGLWDNALSGEIPKEIGNCKKLLMCFLNGNNLTGVIPKEIGNCTALTQLRLDQNELSGVLPSTIGNLKSVTQICLFNNQLSGSLPPSICDLPNLQAIFTYNNNFSGSLPPALGNLSNLTTIQIGDNLHTGSLPTSITTLKKLTEFKIMGNDFSHTKIPAAFEEMHWRLGADFVTDWNKNELYLNDAKKAIDSIKDMEVRGKVTSLQEDLFNHVKNRDTAKADKVFKELKEIAKKQTERLGSTTATVLNYYRFRDNGHRYREIERIEEIPAVKQMAVLGETAAERVKVLLAKANWKETEFQKRMMNEIVDPMNQASSIRDLCETYGIDSSSYVYDKFGNTVELIDPLFAFGDGTASNVLVKERFGPPKGYQRALAKEEEGITKSGADKWIGLRDLNRVTFEFEDPLMLTLACNALMKKFKVSGLKNKFENVHVETYDQPPDIHMNLDLGKGWLVEVQLMFASVLTIKKELHKFYDVVRAEKPRAILSPLFKVAQTNEAVKDEEIERMRKMMESAEVAHKMNHRRESGTASAWGEGAGERIKELETKVEKLESKISRSIEVLEE
mmetsp:Transcript_25677/g.48261  ORF Transcript_25677/g.48261 Transcript_25677/m.48261 type:complete len:639 (+) Transcript_25677:162-2078(+)